MPRSRLNKSPLDTEGFAAAVLDSLSAHICVVDGEGVIIAVNRAWRRFSTDNGGAAAVTDIGAHYLKVCGSAFGPGDDNASEFGEGIKDVLEGRSGLFQCEYPCHSPTKSRWFLGRVTPLGLPEGGAVISHVDITAQKLMEFELAKLAITDSLTGLPNRRYFLNAADRDIARLRRFGIAVSALMIDIDSFKAINDSHGHSVGDEVLRGMARNCAQALREVDIFARLGGEEFVVLLPGADAEGARLVAEKLRSLIEQTPIPTGEGPIAVTASFGVAQVRHDDDSAVDALTRADTALYEAKEAGRNCVRVFAEPSAGPDDLRLAGEAS